MTERLNADYSLPASIRYSELQFIPSPSPHVTRGMLDRVGGEVARASTLVRYASDSSFPAHVHSGGEEFIVLEGEFADEHGEYPSGTYIRNPVGSRHSPSVGKDGCLIFVKLRWMRTPEEPYVLYNVDNGDLRTESPYILDKKSGLAPIETGGKGDARNAVTMYHCPSSTSGTERVRAIKLTKEHPSYEIDAEEVASGGIELLVLSGSLDYDGEAWGKWDWIRRPSACSAMKLELGVGSAECSVFLKTGYLAGWTEEV